METENKLGLHQKLGIWIHFNLIALGAYLAGCLIFDAYQRAFPSKREQLAQNVSKLLDIEEKRGK